MEIENMLKQYAGITTRPSELSPYHLAGWRNPGDDYTLKNYQPDKCFDYDLSYRDADGKKYFVRDKVMAPNAEMARLVVEHYPKVTGMKKIWCCIFVKKPMEIFDGNGM